MRCTKIIFSPTGGTERVTDILTTAMTECADTVDLTRVGTNFSSYSFGPEDVVVIAVPSFGGRVPGIAVQRLAQITAQEAKAVVVCVYGNRAYEDTLVELMDVVKAAGFQVIAAVAAVAEHSIMHQFAAGRPDRTDEDNLRRFGAEIARKLSKPEAENFEVPGNRPYKKAGGGGLVPKTESRCTACGLCVDSCPTGAISKADPKATDSKKCISCMRCVSICPTQARSVSKAMVAIKKACSERKECELYL